VVVEMAQGLDAVVESVEAVAMVVELVVALVSAALVKVHP